MTDRDPITEAARALGRRLAGLRQAAGYTQGTFAPLVHYGRSTVANVETGRQRVNREFWARCDRVLRTGGVLVVGYDRLQAEMARQLIGNTISFDTVADESTALSELRRHLLIRPDQATGQPDAGDLPAEVGSLHLAYQRAHYTTVVQRLPDLLHRAQAWARDATGPQQRPADATLAAANLALSKLAVKLGDSSLAWVAADRAAISAARAEDPILAASAAYSIGCALLAIPNRGSDAQQVVEAALERPPTKIRGGSGPADLSVRGALSCLAALIAARNGRRADAERRLNQAETLAEQLGADRNDLWTGFGPTNVLIHRVSAAVSCDQPEQAIRLGEQIDTSAMPAPLLSRRSQVHLDLAAAFTRRPGGDAPAVLHLLEAERLAPQTFRVRHNTRRLVSDLLRRERRTATPGLRALAERAGIAA